MKNVIFKMLCVVGILALASCSNKNSGTQDLTPLTLFWEIENNTGQDIYFDFTNHGVPTLVSAGQRENIHHYKLIPTIQPVRFDILFDLIPTYRNLYIYLEEKGEPVKVWTRDDAAQPGKQFYNESSWTVKDMESEKSKFWIFSVTPEDVTPTPKE